MVQLSILQSHYVPIVLFDCLVGLAVTAFASRAEDPGLSHTSDLKIGNPVACPAKRLAL